jgi:signal transduction histidine kinase
MYRQPLEGMDTHAGPGPDPAEASKKHAILAVDDEPRIVQLLRRELGREYRVLTATGGPDALKILEGETVTLVIADQRMPGMSGSELMEKIVQRHPHTVRILLTGYTDLNALVEAVNRGQIYYYVTKPWEPDDLKIIVRQGIERFELQDENRLLIQDLKAKNLELFEALEILKKTQQDLLRAERLSTIGKMTNMIVHDLKNPLTSILGLSSLLKSMPGIEEDKRRSYYKLIHEESRRILQMVQEILQFVRGVHPDVSLKPCDPQAYLSEIQNEIEAHLDGSGIRLRMDVRCASPWIIDPEQMKRVLHNLAGNAREAMGQAGEIVITAAEQPDHVLIRVSDTGPGIPRELHHAIFEPFFTRGKKAGNGMGLAIVKQIVEAHHGEVELECSGENGSTFCVRIPRQPAGLASDRLPAGTARMPAP